MQDVIEIIVWASQRWTVAAALGLPSRATQRVTLAATATHLHNDIVTFTAASNTLMLSCYYNYNIIQEVRILGDVPARLTSWGWRGR